MNIRNIGLILIPALILYLVYDKFLAQKDFIPNTQKLGNELSRNEQALLERQFNQKKFKILLKQLSLNTKDFRLYEASPKSRVQRQIRQATASKLKLLTSNNTLKELYKDTDEKANIYYLDTSVSAQNLNVRELTKILTQLRSQRPRLIWEEIRINSNNPERIALSGRVRAFFLSEELSLLLKGGQK